MAFPIILSVGGSSGSGVAGQGRNDLVAGERVDLSDTEAANAGAAYFWEFEDFPIGTTPVMNDAATSTPHFFVDADPLLPGSYRVKATVDGIESSIEILAKPLTKIGSRIPSFQEEIGFDGGGNAKGWHEAMSAFMRAVDANLGVGATGNTIRRPIWFGGRESHNDDFSPLIAGAQAFKPDQYAIAGTVLTFTFDVIVANGSTPLETHVQLFNVTDGVVITSSVIDIVNSTAQVKYSVPLTLGAGAGDFILATEKIYEVRIFLDIPPVDPALDTIELYSAHVIAINTVT